MTGLYGLARVEHLFYTQDVRVIERGRRGPVDVVWGPGWGIRLLLASQYLGEWDSERGGSPSAINEVFVFIQASVPGVSSARLEAAPQSPPARAETKMELKSRFHRWRGAMSDERIGKLAEDALATLRGLADTRQVPRDLGWGDVMTFEGWSVRRARQAQRALGLRLVERGGSVEDVRPKPY